MQHNRLARDAKGRLYITACLHWTSLYREPSSKPTPAYLEWDPIVQPDPTPPPPPPHSGPPPWNGISPSAPNPALPQLLNGTSLYRDPLIVTSGGHRLTNFIVSLISRKQLRIQPASPGHRDFTLLVFCKLNEWWCYVFMCCMYFSRAMT